MITLLIANILGFINAYRTYFILGGLALLFVVILISARSCGKREVKLDEREIQQINNDIQDRNDGKLREKLAEITVKEKVISGEVSNSAANTANATQKAREDAARLTTDQLAAELEKYK